VWELRRHLGTFTAPLAARHGSRPAMTDPAPTPGLHDGGTRTYADVERAVALLAAAHRDHGVGERDRVVVAVGNRIDTALHAFALARLGAVPALVNPRLRPDEAQHVVEATGARSAVADADVAARLALTDVTDVTSCEDVGAAIAAAGARHDVVAAEPRDPDEVSLLLATSGTTGHPKAASLTGTGLLGHAGLLGVLPVGHERGPRGDRDRLLAPLPLAHVMGFTVLVNGLAAGVHLIHVPRFEAAAVLDAIEQHRPNLVVMVPTMYADLEAAGVDGRDCASVQVWASAADVMPDARARRFQRRGAFASIGSRALAPAAFVDAYGMVELSGIAAARVFPPLPIELPAVAVVSPRLEARTVDEEGRRCRWGEAGELEFRGPGVLVGYEGTAGAGPDGEGWFATGDRARLWPGGVMQLVGREKDRLKVGGFSVFPAEVEQALAAGPGVAEVALVGLPDERLGERPVALVVPDDPETFDEAGFLAWSGDTVAGYRRPRAVGVLGTIPRGNNAKVDRPAATELAIGLGRAGELHEEPPRAQADDDRAG
jgi:fatty-acyl-CoA synthase